MHHRVDKGTTMSVIKVESGIPVPVIERVRTAPEKYPFADMRISQSFGVPCTEEEAERAEQRVRTAVYRYTQTQQGTVKFTVRYMPDRNEVRVWRVA